jgi:3-oxoadipate enol-lactonase
MDSVIAHSVTGSGEPLLLLNGGLMTMAGWEEIARPLERDFTVIRCDFRGQLRSPGTPPASLDGHAADVIALLDSLNVDRAHLVGTSFGGFVATLTAARYPERVRSLIAITLSDRITEEMMAGSGAIRAAALDAAEGGDSGRILDLLVPATFSPDYIASNPQRFTLQRQIVAGLPSAYFRGLAGLLDALRGLDLRPELGKITCPALVVGGGRDATFPPEFSRSLAAGIPAARLEIIEEAPHGLVVENAAELISLIQNFLSGPAAQSSPTQTRSHSG